MQITLRQLNNSAAALQTLAEIKFAAKVSYRLSRVLSSAQAELKLLNEAHFELVKKHGEEKDGNRWEVPPDNLAAFVPENEGLLDETVTVWGDPIDIALLGEVEIAPAILAPLGWLITDGEPEKAQAAGV